MAGSDDDTQVPSRADDTADALAPSSSLDPDAFPVPRWERYRPLGLLGRGGMGVVWKALDRRLERVVALKFIRGADPDLIMRFVEEARAQARVDHPGICKVYEVGEVDGKAYISMQLVAGERLDRAAASFTLEEKVGVVRDAALAIHEAHRLGIVHRDLKPGNIVVERREDGAPVPVVMDFGLARDVRRDLGLTSTGALLGTPAYMAPEQARGEGVDRRSDVYSLGATLYELLAGRPPFVAGNMATLLTKLLVEEPPSLPRLPRDLETIALKCLRKDAGERYPSARALAEDLQRYLDGDPILGARPSLFSRVRRQARRHKALVAVSLVSLLILAGGGVWLSAAAGERARVAARLAEDVKEIEWFLRTVRAMPLHDTTAEEAVIRERMARMPAGDAVHDARGRAHLMLHELDEARRELELSSTQTPELHLARGRVLGELYHDALEKARFQGDRAWLAAQRQRLDAMLLTPALRELAQGKEAARESPRYLEGLIALYRGDHEQALRAADEAAAATPWLPETVALGAAAAYARGMAHLDRAEPEAARAALDDAIRRCRRAVDLARSDATLHEGLARAWLARFELDRRARDAARMRESLEGAVTAAEASTTAAPRRATGHTLLTLALLWSYRAPSLKKTDEETATLLLRMEATAARAVALDPDDATAHDALGNVQFSRALFEVRHGRDAADAFAAAITSLEKAVSLAPQYPWALNDLGLAHLKRAWSTRRAGGDPRLDYDAAVTSFERALAADPGYLFAARNLGSAHGELARLALARGDDPTAHAQRAIAAAERALELDPSYTGMLPEIAYAELALAEHLQRSGGDAAAVIERALARLDAVKGVEADLCRALAFELRARREDDPSASIAHARDALHRADESPGCVDCGLAAARVSVLEARWLERQRRSPAPALRRALAEVAKTDAAEARVEEQKIRAELARYP